MSEPMSSVEIEDVLSSIRRLVSEELRSAPKAMAQPAQQPVFATVDKIAADPKKLILTPALRVVPEADPTALEGIVAQVGAAVDRHVDDWEAEDGDAPLMLDIEQGDEAKWTDFAFDDAADAVDVPDSTPSIDTFVSRRAHTAVSSAVPSDDVPAWAQTEAVPQPVDEESAQPAVAEVDLQMADVDLAWADATEAEVIAALETEPQQEPAARFEPMAPATDADDIEARFNESVLRDLVRDIIREELQGELGERITRNIRKLVRTEISRSLAAQHYQ